MTKMRHIKMISDLSFCIGRLEGTHAGLILGNKQFEGMDVLLQVAEKINENVDILHEWFKEQYPE
jgi:hypothetical protein